MQFEPTLLTFIGQHIARVATDKIVTEISNDIGIYARRTRSEYAVIYQINHEGNFQFFIAQKVHWMNQLCILLG